MINLADFWPALVNTNFDNNEYWKQKVREVGYKVHLALMIEPYLSLILEGRKTIESRFSTKKIIPYNNISKGDIVVLKKSGGDLTAIFEVEDVEFKEIKGDSDFQEIKEKFEEELCLEEKFWINKKEAKYVTLIKIGHLQVISPITIKRPNRQSWLTFDIEQNETPISRKFVCITGKIASGKTTVASKLATEINGEQYSVSDYLKDCLKNRGIEKPSRDQLQDIGEQFISKGWGEFCDDFLSYINYDKNKTFVIDGIRHKKFFDVLCNKIYPDNPLLIYLDVDDEILEMRKNKRKEKEYNDKRLAEGKLSDLYFGADYIIKTSQKSIVDVVDEIKALINEKLSKKKVKDSEVFVQDLKDTINEFNKNRNWLSAHNAMNLAMSISIEASELLEIFQWSDRKNADKRAKFSDNTHVKDELADIIIYCINLANAYEIDISSCIIEKMLKNAKKYPPIK